ncbi:MULTISPECIES: hypothetical protein [unclassified Aquimarina]|uniref:hypothetical protein n=1 Tax=unclassified Aquimarina TaxID=2627091 RepID=UPI000E4A01F9|nr:MULTISPECIES: hypothetical protein [unclassified Aquimarina]AXT53049.1 hypothetical protein D1818_20290 [Aquimarina sp. BL5]KAA1242703.1 hypothetical protein F0000_24445 [Aquimarina sp. RZ0]RKM91338.1 hypothetical protein D7036_23470 [Aquimarina sp. BL5]
MKKIIISFAALCLIVASTSCREKKSTGEKIEDAVEEVGDAVEDGAEEVKDAVEDVTDDN